MSDTRITRRLNNNIIEFVDGKGYGNLSHSEGVKLLFERLAAYEDIKLSPAEILSLITTIESLQEQKEAQRLDYLTLHGDFLKQKEEIRRRVIQAEINIGLGETVINMQSEIKSLKVITELAVKGLKEISDGGSTGEDARDMRRTSDYTLSEIERLSQ